jgi:hypothetical protein
MNLLEHFVAFYYEFLNGAGSADLTEFGETVPATTAGIAGDSRSLGRSRRAADHLRGNIRVAPVFSPDNKTETGAAMRNRKILISSMGGHSLFVVGNNRCLLRCT